MDRGLVEHFFTELNLLDHLEFARNIFCHEHSVISAPILSSLFNEVCFFSLPACLLPTLKDLWLGSHKGIVV